VGPIGILRWDRRFLPDTMGLAALTTIATLALGW